MPTPYQILIQSRRQRNKIISNLNQKKRQQNEIIFLTNTSKSVGREQIFQNKDNYANIKSQQCNQNYNAMQLSRHNQNKYISKVINNNQQQLKKIMNSSLQISSKSNSLTTKALEVQTKTKGIIIRLNEENKKNGQQINKLISFRANIENNKRKIKNIRKTQNQYTNGVIISKNKYKKGFSECNLNYKIMKIQQTNNQNISIRKKYYSTELQPIKPKNGQSLFKNREYLQRQEKFKIFSTEFSNYRLMLQSIKLNRKKFQTNKCIDVSLMHHEKKKQNQGQKIKWKSQQNYQKVEGWNTNQEQLEENINQNYGKWKINNLSN